MGSYPFRPIPRDYGRIIDQLEETKHTSILGLNIISAQPQNGLYSPIFAYRSLRPAVTGDGRTDRTRILQEVAAVNLTIDKRERLVSSWRDGTTQEPKRSTPNFGPEVPPGELILE